MVQLNLSINPKLERITQIYERLSRSSATITELARELNVSTKTIQRDLHKVLSEAGAVCNGRSWKIDKSKAADGLKSDEAIILGILDGMAKGVGEQFYLKAHNLIEQISSNLNHPIYANIDGEMLNLDHLAIFSKLENAIKDRHIIEFRYKNSSYKIKPLKLAFFDGLWYLLALDVNSNDTFKKFHLKSIMQIAVLDGRFEIPKELDEKLQSANSIWFELDKEAFTVRLFLEKDIVSHFERKPLKSQIFTGRYYDGTAEIEIKATHKMEVLPLVRWYMPLVKIVEPEWLAEEVKAMLSNYLNEIGGHTHS